MNDDNNDYHRGTMCKTCGRKFHWCTSCQCISDRDYAADDGYCCVECAKVANPEWQPDEEVDCDE
jgi:hypothetical protein